MAMHAARQSTYFVVVRSCYGLEDCSSLEPIQGVRALCEKDYTRSGGQHSRVLKNYFGKEEPPCLWPPGFL